MKNLAFMKVNNDNINKTVEDLKSNDICYHLIGNTIKNKIIKFNNYEIDLRP